MVERHALNRNTEVVGDTALATIVAAADAAAAGAAAAVQLSNTTKGGRNHRNWWREEKGQTAQSSSTQQIQEIKPKKQRSEGGTTPDFNQRKRHAEQEGTLAVTRKHAGGHQQRASKAPSRERRDSATRQGNLTASRMRS